MIVDWDTQVQAVAKERYAGGLESAAKRGVERLADKLAELRSENRWSIEDLRNLVSTEILQSISELYAKTVWVVSGARRRAKNRGAYRPFALTIHIA